MAASTLFITGATGVLGSATLAHLLRTRPECRILALVRAASPAEATARLQRALARFDEPGLAPARADAVEIVLGDVTEPATYDDPRLADVSHVLHLAANTSFRSVGGVRRVNILGTRTLARRMQSAPRLERFLHVSTAYCCGLGADEGRVLGEDDYPRAAAEHAVEYTRSKAEAELLLDEMADTLPLVIARPSAVVGHTRLGCVPSASLFWFFRTVDLLRRSPWPLAALEDIVPVDYTAAALTTLLFQGRLPHRRYHISAGTTSSCSWHEITAAFARHHGPRPEDPHRVVDWATLSAEREQLASRLGPGDLERLFLALELYCRFPSLLFDNSRLLAAGLPAPPRFVDYLDRCITQPRGRTVCEQMTDDD